MSTRLSSALLGSAVFLIVPFSSAVAVQDGLFIGGSIGSATVEANVEGLPGDIPSSFDENDTGWKIYGGYNWVLAKTFGLGIEGGYVNFGKPSGNAGGALVKVEPTAIDIFGVVGFDIGPVGIFGKLGYAWWDADLKILDQPTFSSDGNDVAYGVGARFNLWSLEIRGEYEVFDVSDLDDLTMWSVGVVWRF